MILTPFLILWYCGYCNIRFTKMEYQKPNLIKLKELFVVEEIAGRPLFLAVVTGIGSTYHKREDGVCVVPIDCLKP